MLIILKDNFQFRRKAQGHGHTYSREKDHNKFEFTLLKKLLVKNYDAHSELTRKGQISILKTFSIKQVKL